MEKLLGFILKNRLMMNLAMVLIIIGGIMSFPLIRQESFPATDIDTLVVRVLYPGASARDLELNAIVPIEEKIEEISGIREFVSHSMENSGMIYIYLDENLKDPQKVKDEIFRKISRNSLDDLPDEVEDITITDLNPKLRPVVTFAVIPETDSADDYRRALDYTDILSKKIRQLDGVSGINKTGYHEKEIHIDIDPEKLNRYQVSLNEVVAAIQSRNIRASGGTLQSLDHELSIITIGKFKNSYDVSRVIIRTNDLGYKTTIGDVATVTESFRRPDVMTRVNGKHAILLSVKKKEEADIIKTAERVRAMIEGMEGKHPGGMKVITVDDQSRIISSLLSVVASNAVMGFFIVLLVLIAFLDIRTAFWTAFGIPLSLAMVLIVMRIFDITLNMISLGAIITVLGMMVDHGIVISEVIYEKRRQGQDVFHSAISGVTEVFAPVSITVLTTILAFLPLISITGLMGKFTVLFPVITSTTLIASFIEAIFFLPGHLAHVPRGYKKKGSGGWFNVITELYGKLLVTFLRFRYAVVAVFMALTVAVVFSSVDNIKNFILIFDDSSNQILIRVESPDGTSLERMNEHISLLEKRITTLIDKKYLVSVVSTVGNNDKDAMFSRGMQNNWAKIEVNLTPSSERDIPAKKFELLLKDTMKRAEFPMFTMIHIEEVIIGPPFGEPVNIKVVTDDEKSGKEIAEKIKGYLGTLKGVYNIDDDYKQGKKELIIEFDYDAMSMAGITVEEVARTVRIAYEGTEATSARLVKDKISYRVQVQETLKKDRVHLENLLIANRENRLIKLKNFARITEEKSITAIDHYNGDRVVTVTASVDKELTTSAQVTAGVAEKFSAVSREYPNTYIVTGGEAKETMKAFSGLATAFLLALLLIYATMVLLFKSFTQPFLILLTIPFGVVGALISFNVHSMPLSFLGIIGIIGLAGVVVNDSIVMVDFINKVFAEGKFAHHDREAVITSIVTGAKSRLRAVILTTVTTVAGLLPTVYGIGGKASIIVPAVMAMAYGLMLATIVTLVFVPAVYLINEDMKNRAGKLFAPFRNKITGHPAE